MSLLPVYKPKDLDLTHGKGAFLYGRDGTAYLDFVSGIAVNGFGHAHPELVDCLKEQAEKLWHISNVFAVPGAKDYAKALTDACFADYVFLTNSGTEAIECLVKMVRKHFAHQDIKKHRIICFSGAFHGRSMSAISASKPEEKMQGGFAPLLPGFDHVPFNDLNAVEAAITEETAAILLEPIQGEGGICAAPKAFLQGLRKLADKHGLLLCLDEIQCGMGRTGYLFAHEYYGITPDIVACAKGIGSGFPIGACLATKEAASGMVIGSHGSTFGGNPLAVAVGHQTLTMLQRKQCLEHVVQMGTYFKEQLIKLANEYPNIIAEIRGRGLMLGMQLHVDVPSFLDALRAEQLLVVGASDQVVRLLPPLIVTKDEIDQATSIIASVAKS